MLDRGLKKKNKGKELILMDWNFVSAIGTILAAFVGILGIWLNVWDKQRKLDVQFEFIPSAKLYISNNSQRSVMVTKIICSIDEHMFYVEHLEGLQEIYLQPATSKSVFLKKDNIYNSYFQHQLESICNPERKVSIILYDNYNRKYELKTDFPIGVFKE